MNPKTNWQFIPCLIFILFNTQVLAQDLLVFPKEKGCYFYIVLDLEDQNNFPYTLQSYTHETKQWDVFFAALYALWENPAGSDSSTAYSKPPKRLVAYLKAGNKKSLKKFTSVQSKVYLMNEYSEAFYSFDVVSNVEDLVCKGKSPRETILMRFP